MIPDLREALPIIFFALVAPAVREWSRFGGQAVAGFVFAGRHVTKRTRAMCQYEMQVRLSQKRSLDLLREIVHHIQ